MRWYLPYLSGFREGLPQLHHARHMADAGSEEGKGQQGKEAGKGDEGKGRDNGQAQFLTQEHLNAVLAKERRAWETKAEKDREPLTKELEELRGIKDEFTEFKKIIEEAAAESEDEETRKGKGGSGYDPLDEFEKEFQVPPQVRDKETYLRLKKQIYVQGKTLGELQALVKEQAGTVADLRKMAETEREGRQIAERARIGALRDSELSKALTANRCIDVESGIILFRDRVVWDDNRGRFVYTTRGGEKTSVGEGIKEEIPNYMIQAAVSEGGAGSSAGRAVSDNELQNLQSELETAEKYAKANPNPRAVQEYQRVKRRVTEAKERKKVAGS